MLAKAKGDAPNLMRDARRFCEKLLPIWSSGSIVVGVEGRLEGAGGLCNANTGSDLCPCADRRARARILRTIFHVVRLQPRLACEVHRNFPSHGCIRFGRSILRAEQR